MNIEIKDRMDGLSSLHNLDKIIFASIEIYEDLIEEGFDHNQIKEYLNDIMNGALRWKQEESDCQLRVIDGPSNMK